MDITIGKILLEGNISTVYQEYLDTYWIQQVYRYSLTVTSG